MIKQTLVDINKTSLDLHLSSKFLEIYQDKKAYVQTIIDEMNNEKIIYKLNEVGFDEIFLTPYAPNQDVYAKKS
jgi:hypothetical protein